MLATILGMAESKTELEPVRINKAVMRKLRIIAAFYDVSVPKYITDQLTPVIESDYNEMTSRMDAEPIAISVPERTTEQTDQLSIPRTITKKARVIAAHHDAKLPTYIEWRLTPLVEASFRVVSERLQAGEDGVSTEQSNSEPEPRPEPSPKPKPKKPKP